MLAFPRAKINLGLNVLARRPDGYHAIESVFVPVPLNDALEVIIAPELGTNGLEYTRTGLHVPGSVDTDLCYKAVRLLQRSQDLPGLRMHLHKVIPHGGGLGGGSSDAAAVLRWAGYTDVAGATRLGADVSFCLVGGRARVRGIGEVVEPLPFQAQDITLVVPPLAVSTPAAYRAWDELGGPTADGPNDLEPAALVVEPRLAEWRDRIAEAAGQRPVLAGSGATWFLPGHHAIADALPDAMVALTRTDRPQ